ncbi:hypothetical protein [Nitrosomonas sp. ANs5]
MIEKSNSTSLALATIAILGQPPSGYQGGIHTRSTTRHCQAAPRLEPFCV